uniref:Arginyl-tRNA--protein transferase 1 n=1 Tax=Knipowitschia caucasica TaxID=637954 RepID=A0AAV2JKY4_KNICA
MAENKSYTIVEYFGGDSGYQCGYCKNSVGNFSYGMWSHTMTVQDYQDLIDRGWRRSGKYVYKPILNKTCCPQYTIRCHTLKFQPSKSHKKIVKKMNKFLSKGDLPKGEGEEGESMMCDAAAQREPSSSCPSEAKCPSVSQIHQEDCPNTAPEPEQQNTPTEASPNDTSVPPSSSGPKPDISGPALHLIIVCIAQQADIMPLSWTVYTQDTSHFEREPGDARRRKLSCFYEVLTTAEESTGTTRTGADPNRPQCRKAKNIRNERRLQKEQKRQSADGIAPTTKPPPSASNQSNQPKSLEDLVAESLLDCTAHGLEVRLVRSNPPCPQFKGSFDASYQVYKLYQMAIHKDPPEKPSESQVRLVPVNFDDPQFSASYEQSTALYARYQTTIHNDDECNESEFRRFLCDSPLEAEHSDDGPEVGYGSFHQQYWLDGRIVAVGVIDILPSCVSSVYLYYDPDFASLSLGSYSALREIAFTRQLQKQSPKLCYYYLGFYIHSCPKMRYKGQYRPADLLCPETFSWVSIERCVPKLDQSRYSRFKQDPDAGDVAMLKDVGRAMVLYKRTVMPYAVYCRKRKGSSDEEEVKQFASLVGQFCAERILLYRS